MTLHIYPIEDWIKHRVDESADEVSCPCEPTIEYVDAYGVPLDEPIVIHNALDGRK